MQKNVLFIDDDADTLEYLRDLIVTEVSEEQALFHTAENLDDGVNLVKEHSVDLIVCDLILVDEKGTDIFEKLENSKLENKPDIIFLSMANKEMFNDWDTVAKADAYFDKFNDFNRMVTWLKEKIKS
jgi:DNA-binding response OmpR family regulator